MEDHGQSFTFFLVVGKQTGKQTVNLSTSGHVFVLQTDNDKLLDLHLVSLHLCS